MRDLIGRDDVDAAYAVQSIFRDAALAAGRTVVGRKIGLTSEAVQRQLGVDRPDFGYLFADMRVAPSEPVPAARLLQPKIEAEVAFVLTADLDGPTDAATVCAAAGLAEAARRHGDSLRAGQVVLSGALGPMVPVGPGQQVRAEIEGLGAVSVGFSADGGMA